MRHGLIISVLTFKKSLEFNVEGYSGSDYATNEDKRRSVSGIVFQVRGNILSWKSVSSGVLHHRGGVHGLNSTSEGIYLVERVLQKIRVQSRQC